MMPSPTMRTVCPSRRRAATYSALSAGSTPARKSSTPSWAAMAAAVRGLSPVSMTVFFTPSLRRAENTSFASSR
ncbi:translation initiation factor IF-1, partial [Dysosmobacter welbionis]